MTVSHPVRTRAEAIGAAHDPKLVASYFTDDATFQGMHPYVRQTPEAWLIAHYQVSRLS